MSNTNNDENLKLWITTLDNPFSPFTQWDEWYNFDMLKGYNTCGYVARIARVSDAMSPNEYDTEVERAIDEIVKYNPLDLYIKVRSNTPAIKLMPVVERH